MIDFLFGLLVFMVVFSLLVSSWFSNRNVLEQEETLRKTKLSAEQALDSLVRTQGYPADWETLSIDDVNWIGLASQDRVLDEGKVAQLRSWSGDWNTTQANYSKVKEKLNLGEFEFHLSIQSVPPVSMGWENDLNTTTISLSRVVTYQGSVTKIALKVYSRK